MKRPARKRKSQPKDQSLEALLRKALREPGVAEMMKVFDGWRATDAAASAYMLAMEDQQVVTASDSSRALNW